MPYLSVSWWTTGRTYDVVYGDIGFAGLRVITCGGSFDRGARSYVDNIVAFAELIAVRTA